MIKTLFVLLVVGAAVLGILIGYDAIKFDADKLPLSLPSGQAPEGIANAPEPTSPPILVSRKSPGETATPSPIVVPIPTAAAIATPTVEPTPTWTPMQIFNQLDKGKITIEQAKAMLAQEQARPTTTPVTIPDLPGYAKPTVTPPPDYIERGSAQWIEDLENLIHQLINVKRQQAALTTLSYDDPLAGIATAHSADMATNQYLSHTNLAGQSPSDRAESASYTCTKQQGTFYTRGIGENIFQGWLFASRTYVDGVLTRNYMTMDQLADQIVEGWMDSPGHRANVVRPSYDKEGIGVTVGPDEKVLVTQNFC